MGVRKSHLIHTPTTIFPNTSSTLLSSPVIHKHPRNTKSQIIIAIPISLKLSFLFLVTPSFDIFASAILASMAAVNSSVLACSYAISGVSSSEVSSKFMPSSASQVVSGSKLPVIKAQQQKTVDAKEVKDSEGRRAALLGLATVLFATTAASTPSAHAGIIEEYLEKSKANKELNDRKRLATSGANFARAYTVEFGTCKFPENFTGCQDLAKQKKVPFLSDDLELECEGKDKFKCGSNVFWKW